MTSLEIKLASVVAHLAEYLLEEHPADIAAAVGVLGDAEVSKSLSQMKSGALLPESRSHKSITEMLEAMQ